jgi:leucyl/phenylalanyl-tRNA---protein transferase
MAALQSQREWLDPELVLKAYMIGVFPMAEGADSDELMWIKPEVRGILPLDAFHLSKRLARTLRSSDLEFRFSTDFNAVIDGCAEAKTSRETTWINGAIRTAYGELFKRGIAIRLRLGGVMRWSAGFMAYHSDPRFLAKACFRGKLMLPNYAL